METEIGTAVMDVMTAEATMECHQPLLRRWRLLPRIRTRAVPVRLQRLSDAEVRGFLQREIEPALAPQVLEVRVAAAAGSIGEAFAAGEEPGKHW